MPDGGWNHNIQYHGFVLKSVPHGCKCALDVGCGEGLLARKLSPHCGKILAIDADHESLSRARAAAPAETRVFFVHGDVMKHPFSPSSFDLITVVATLHHLPLRPALTLFRELLRPGGVLVVVGLYRARYLGDYASAAVAVPVSWALRRLRGNANVGAPLLQPKETLQEIRSACETLLPGARFKRRLLFRYSVVWRKE